MFLAEGQEAGPICEDAVGVEDLVGGVDFLVRGVDELPWFDG
jgi:hypothetical protein